jgi:ABC-type glycerol-3-phosphate transport system permease component
MVVGTVVLASALIAFLAATAVTRFRFRFRFRTTLLVFFKPDENDRGGIMAGSTVMTIPVLVFFVLVQRRPVSGLGGAVKD